MKLSVFALLSSLLVLCGFGNAGTSIASTGGVATGKSQQITDAATVPQGLNGVEWASIQKQMGERQHAAVSWFPAAGGEYRRGLYSAQPDPEQQLHHLLHR